MNVSVPAQSLCRRRQQLADLLLDIGGAEAVELDALLHATLCNQTGKQDAPDKPISRSSVRIVCVWESSTTAGDATYRIAQRRAQAYRSPLAPGTARPGSTA